MVAIENLVEGQQVGPIGQQLMGAGFDAGLMRPYLNEDDQLCVSINTGKYEDITNEETGEVRREYLREEIPMQDFSTHSWSPAAMALNATLALRKEEWIRMDQRVVQVYRQRLRATDDLISSGLTMGGFDGMGTLILEHEAVSDPGEALRSMEGIAEGRNDAPLFQLRGTPLPITHSSFSYSRRQLMASRNKGVPVSTVSAESHARRIAEMVEKQVIGSVAAFQFGTAANYDQSPANFGYMNHPDRFIKNDMTAPTGSNNETVLSEILELIEGLINLGFDGPFALYVSKEYDRHLKTDFKTSSDKNARQRLLEDNDIVSIRRLNSNYMTTANSVIAVQMTSDVAQLINGMGITTLQWDTQGGMEHKFKVMTIQALRLTSDINGNLGVAIGTTS